MSTPAFNADEHPRESSGRFATKDNQEPTGLAGAPEPVPTAALGPMSAEERQALIGEAGGAMCEHLAEARSYGDLLGEMPVVDFDSDVMVARLAEGKALGAAAARGLLHSVRPSADDHLPTANIFWGAQRWLDNADQLPSEFSGQADWSAKDRQVVSGSLLRVAAASSARMDVCSADHNPAGAWYNQGVFIAAVEYANRIRGGTSTDEIKLFGALREHTMAKRAAGDSGDTTPEEVEAVWSAAARPSYGFTS